MWLIKWHIKRLKEKQIEDILYLILTKNPKYPLTDTQAKATIRMAKQLRRSNSYLFENELSYLLRKWESNRNDRGYLDKDPRD